MRANPNETFRQFKGFVKPDDLVTVTIGRNVGDVPLGITEWDAFQAGIKSNVSALISPSAVFGPFYGVGVWNGVTEDSVVFTFIPSYTVQINDLEDVLTDLAEHYGQDAIAYSVGTARLAQRKTVTV